MFALEGQTTRKGKQLIVSGMPPVNVKYKTLLRQCDQCKGCRVRRRMELALRLEHESQFNEHSWFVTLTYNDEHLPAGGSVNIKAIPDFIRMLRQKLRRKKIKQKLRYFAVSEYGGQTGRAHYHLILFGPDFPDRKISYTKPSRANHSESFIKLFGIGGARYYTSELLENVWGNGFAQLTSVSQATMQYVAKFHIDKVTGEKAAEYYSYTDESGNAYNLEPEQCRMSTNPGLGRKWIEKYWKCVYPRGYIIGHGGVKFAPPKYYDAWLEKNHPKVYLQVKEQRAKEISLETLLEQKRDAIAKIRMAQLGLNASIGSGQFKGRGATAAELTVQAKRL